MVLRARIDMASPNMNLRDPAIYRIRFAEHHATGDKWCIYPMYTFAHPIEDSLEEITHSICTLEFEDQRAFYDWALERVVPVLRTPQFEEAKAVLTQMKDRTHPKAAEFAAACFAAREKLGQMASRMCPTLQSRHFLNCLQIILNTSRRFFSRRFLLSFVPTFSCFRISMNSIV